MCSADLNIWNLKTIGHHTCLKDGGEDFVLQKSPFYAEHNPAQGKHQFLGSGYYFWDNNLELSKVWGKNRCGNNYFVIEIDIDLLSENCYDLVGNRNHQIHLMNALKEYEAELGVDKSKEWTLNQCISFLKELSNVDEQIFPYKLVRAVDLLNHEQYKEAQKLIKFTSEKGNYTIINPKIVIFAFDKQDLNLETKRIVAS